MIQTGDNEYKGVCKSCMRRFRCPKAQLYLDLPHCNAYKRHKLKKGEGQNDT